jgi:hypothetical protein
LSNIHKLSSNSENFIEKANLIHDNNYGYSLVDYINANTKVVIICELHGEFQQRPARHLIGDGCKQCAILSRSNKESTDHDDL